MLTHGRVIGLPGVMGPVCFRRVWGRNWLTSKNPMKNLEGNMGLEGAWTLE